MASEPKPDTAAYRAYMICTAPRSGSTMLCRMLTATGVAGRPKSYFYGSALADWEAYFAVAPDHTAPESDRFRAVVSAAVSRGAGETGVVGLRMQRHSFPAVLRHAAAAVPSAQTDVARLEALFGQTLFVHLTRQDKIAQAVSLLKAEQSGLWHRAPDGSEIERLTPTAPQGYDADAIAEHVARFIGFDADWEAWFAEEGIEPLRLAYEAVAEDPGASLAAVLAALGRPARAATGVAPDVARLADAESQAWIDRFRRERAGG